MILSVPVEFIFEFAVKVLVWLISLFCQFACFHHMNGLCYSVFNLLTYIIILIKKKKLGCIIQASEATTDEVFASGPRSSEFNSLNVASFKYYAIFIWNFEVLELVLYDYEYSEKSWFIT